MVQINEDITGELYERSGNFEEPRKSESLVSTFDFVKNKEKRFIKMEKESRIYHRELKVES
jgi:hypothetical protein